MTPKYPNGTQQAHSALMICSNIGWGFQKVAVMVGLFVAVLTAKFAVQPSHIAGLYMLRGA